jgi:hypothetical protein
VKMKGSLQDARAANERLQKEILKLTAKISDDDIKSQANLLPS